MGAFRKELVAHMQLLLGADAHECFDIRLLERTEHVIEFLHGSLLGRGEPTEPPSRDGFDDPDVKVFQQELETLGWSEGRNIHIDYRYAPAAAQVEVIARNVRFWHKADVALLSS